MIQFSFECTQSIFSESCTTHLSSLKVKLPHDHPSPLSFNRLRNYLLGRNSGIVSSAQNTEDQTDSGTITVTENSFQSAISLPGKYDRRSGETITA